MYVFKLKYKNRNLARKTRLLFILELNRDLKTILFLDTKGHEQKHCFAKSNHGCFWFVYVNVNDGYVYVYCFVCALCM